MTTAMIKGAFDSPMIRRRRQHSRAHAQNSARARATTPRLVEVVNRTGPFRVIMVPIGRIFLLFHF